MRGCVAIVVALVACKEREPARPAPARAVVADAAAHQGCEQLPFADTTPVPEASAAAWLEIDGKLSLVVVGDSGNDGAYGIVDPDSGQTGEQGKLPLGGASDDVEGLAVRGDRMYGLVSNGTMLVWKRKAGGFELVDGPYPIGAPGDMVCKKKAGNCGRNYEGLALAAHPSSCAGFACSKADGTLYCLADQNGRLMADRTRAIHVDKPEAVADCAFSDTDALWVGDNFFGLSQVFRVDGWQDPATAKVVPIQPLGVGFAEVIAVRGDVIYRMSDTGGAPSGMAKFRCAAIPR